MSQASLKSTQQSFLKFSTPGIEERWWRVEVETDDLRWIQKNLGHGLDFQKEFRTKTSKIAPTGAAYPGCPWSDRVAFVEGESAPRVLVSLGEAYNYHKAYALAREQGDPQLSPHGLFRNLEAGYHKHAFQFMQRFGPLFIDSATRFRGDSWWFSLADFWDRHARFVAVSKLWEDRFDPDKLREHWAVLLKEQEKLDRAGAAPLGYIPDPTHQFIPSCQMPWLAKIDETVSPKEQAVLSQRLFYELVRSELILHTQDCVLTWTVKEQPLGLHNATVFEPTRCFTSLWGAIWELFGLDTRHYGWKLCQACGKLFYPRTDVARVVAQNISHSGASDYGHKNIGLR